MSPAKKTSSKSEKKLRDQLKTELERSVLVEPTDREYWLSELDNLPMPIVNNLLKILTPRNAQIDSYVETALSQDQNQEHLKALRQQVATIKKQAYKLEEKGVSRGEAGEEEELLQQLEDL